MNVEVGRNLIKLREQHNLTQYELSEKINVDLYKITEWENGINLPETENLLKLSQLYNISIDELLVKKSNIPQDSWGNKNGGNKLVNKMSRFPYPLVITIIYLIMGFYCGLWHPGWLIYLTIPLYYMIVDSIKHKRSLLHNLYSIIVIATYFFVGIVHETWHPTWIIFLTIPVYNSIVGDNIKSNKKRVHIHKRREDRY